MRKVLIIDQMHDSIIPRLESIGVQPTYMPNITAEEVHQHIPEYEGLILRSKMKVKVDLLDKAPHLKFVARAGAGVDEIDEEYLEQRKITLINAPEGNMDAVGEHTIGMLLSLLNKLHQADKEVRNYQWRREENRGYELGNLTVGIVGYGNMGQAFAQRLTGFGCKVIAYDNGKTGYGDQYAEEVNFKTLQRDADVLSFHIPLNEANRFLVSQSYLDGFHKPLFLLNLGRGEIMSLKTVQWGLQSGKLRGAGLDVLENEKLHTLTEEQKEVFDWMIQQENILFTPHVGGWTYESYERINEVLVRKIKALLEEI
ncbi:NAD(P)-dependent oxidoreductase [Algivirga pacifica]|uniref:2-hydroxyacid dehydrogenase n=1 Tax=Algivirga pacifica TaxID=1162670 RepID=A0ABP9DJS3_9BACT